MRDERCVAVSSQLAGSITTNSCDDSTNPTAMLYTFDTDEANQYMIESASLSDGCVVPEVPDQQGTTTALTAETCNNSQLRQQWLIEAVGVSP